MVLESFIYLYFTGKMPTHGFKILYYLYFTGKMPTHGFRILYLFIFYRQDACTTRDVFIVHQYQIKI